jgi:hypothetical protein
MDRAAARRLRLVRRAFALTVAGAAHVAILSLMALGLADRQARPPEPHGETRFVGVYMSVRGPEAALSKRRLRRASPTRAAPPPSPRITPPSTTAPAVAASNGPADTRAQAAPDGEDARLRAALRSLAGCDYRDLSRLTEAERERCRQRLDQTAQQAHPLPPGPADPRKRALLDHEIRVDEAWRAYRRSNRMDDYPGLRTIIPALKPLFGDEPLQPSADGPGPH